MTRGADNYRGVQVRVNTLNDWVFLAWKLRERWLLRTYTSEHKTNTQFAYICCHITYHSAFSLLAMWLHIVHMICSSRFVFNEFGGIAMRRKLTVLTRWLMIMWQWCISDLFLFKSPACVVSESTCDYQLLWTFSKKTCQNTCSILTVYYVRFIVDAIYLYICCWTRTLLKS